MIYLSRLLLNPRHRQVRADLADCHDLHRTVLAAFPKAPVGEDVRQHFGVLHRLEVDTQRSGRATLLVQSGLEPDWAHLPEGYLLPSNDLPNPACKRLDSLYDAIRVGSILRFRLRANPTRKVDTKSGPDGKRNNGRRIELRREEEQLAWLARKGESGGFQLLHVRAAPNVFAVQAAPDGQLKGRRAERTLTFGSVIFEGELRVSDAERFRETLRRGIGSGKAYGFGLLSVAPPPQ